MRIRGIRTKSGMMNKIKIEKKRVSYNRLADSLLVLSFFLYTYRGNLGAIVALCSMLLRLNTRKILVRHTRPLLIAWTLFLSIFAVMLYSFRNINFEPYVFIAYIFAIFNILLSRQIDFNYVIKMIYKVSFLYVFSVWFQFLLPGFYSSLARIFFPSRIYLNIMTRMYGGYMTGFTREVAYVALIVLLGLMYVVFFCKGKKRIGLSIIFLSTLFITGKKAHPIFAVIAIALTYYLRTKNLKKHLKIWLICFCLLGGAAITFPFWKNFSFMSRIVAFIDGIQIGLDLNALTSGRAVIYERALELWSENKLWGIGWENFRNFGAYGTSEYTTWFRNYDVHNCYLQVLCETGIAGIILFVAILLCSVAQAIRTLRYQDDSGTKFAFSYFFFFWIYAITEPCMYQDSYFILLFLCICEMVWRNRLIFDKSRLEKHIND